MNALPDKPTGSLIQDQVGPEGVTLFWLNPSPGPARFGMAALLALCLCGWTVAEVKLLARRRCVPGFLYACGRARHVAALDNAPARASGVGAVRGRGAPLRSWPQAVQSV